MCGIAGITHGRGLDAIGGLDARLAAAIARLRRRGPDAESSWRDPLCAFVHTRLAVIDLSANAAQPMAAHGRVITYNGEIYNFAELRDDLAARGYAFSSASDTEVLLAGWDAWGDQLLQLLFSRLMMLR